MSPENARVIEIVDGWATAEESDRPIDRLEKLLNAAREEERARVPEGWKLVPAEATVDMMAAYCRQMNTGTQEFGERNEAGCYQAAAYRAMLDAAPAPDARNMVDAAPSEALARAERETAWLIEQDAPHGSPVWFTATGPEWRFSRDANDALRFARKQDAETFIKWIGSSSVLSNPRATEHVWVSPAPDTVKVEIPPLKPDQAEFIAQAVKREPYDPTIVIGVPTSGTVKVEP